MKTQHDYSLMSLSVKDALNILIFYGIIFLLALLTLIYILVNRDTGGNLTQNYSIAVLIASSVVGSTIFYSRKLYKAGINNSYKFEEQIGLTAPRVGTLAFFILRPFFGVAFAILAYALWRASVVAATKEIAPPPESIFLVLPIGFFSGFSAGRLVEQFEERNTSSFLKTDDK